ncbi:MAG: SMP-30/gluconolactonase/LRE family protein [Alphaproteobacteria bacterium]
MQEVATGYGLIEGPTWDPARGLIFSDVINGGAFCLAPDGSIHPVIEHRRGMGGIALHADGGLIVSGRNISYKPPGGGDTVVLLQPDEARGEMGFNDLSTDMDGRIFCGSVAFRPVGSDDEPKPGSLYSIDLDGSARHLHFPVELTNGIGISPDGSTLYHSDSSTCAVWAQDLDGQGGIAHRQVFADLGDGRPDGLAVGADGSVFIADAAKGRVAVFAADGAEKSSIPVPLPMVTSVCFGGEGLSDLYIVTGSRGTGRDDAGTIFRTDAGVAGSPVPLARVTHA